MCRVRTQNRAVLGTRVSPNMEPKISELSNSRSLRAVKNHWNYACEMDGFDLFERRVGTLGVRCHPVGVVIVMWVMHLPHRLEKF
jgi:hypothetical protein